MYETVVIGVSAGGMQALKQILPLLPAAFPLPIAIVQHMAPNPDSYLAEYLGQICELRVKEAEDKEPLRPGTVYIAPGGYHLLIEPGPVCSLSVDERVNYSCPAIDVLFESASDIFKNRLIGVVLTGANADGSKGLKTVKERGGIAIVQNPADAESPYMPQAALKAVKPDYVADLKQIAPLLLRLCGMMKEKENDLSLGR